MVVKEVLGIYINTYIRTSRHHIDEEKLIIGLKAVGIDEVRIYGHGMKSPVSILDFLDEGDSLVSKNPYLYYLRKGHNLVVDIGINLTTKNYLIPLARMHDTSGLGMKSKYWKYDDYRCRTYPILGFVGEKTFQVKRSALEETINPQGDVELETQFFGSARCPVIATEDAECFLKFYPLLVHFINAYVPFTFKTAPRTVRSLKIRMVGFIELLSMLKQVDISGGRLELRCAGSCFTKIIQMIKTQKLLKVNNLLGKISGFHFVSKDDYFRNAQAMINIAIACWKGRSTKPIGRDAFIMWNQLRSIMGYCTGPNIQYVRYILDFISRSGISPWLWRLHIIADYTDGRGSMQLEASPNDLKQLGFEPGTDNPAILEIITEARLQKCQRGKKKKLAYTKIGYKGFFGSYHTDREAALDIYEKYGESWRKHVVIKDTMRSPFQEKVDRGKENGEEEDIVVLEVESSDSEYQSE